MSILILCLTLITFATPCLAQYDAPEKPNVITVNPFLAMFEWYSGEYERTFSPKYSIAISGSYVSIGDVEDNDEITWSGVDISPRFYPQEGAPGGLYFAGRLGFRKAEETFTDFFTGEETESSQTFTSLGFEIGFTYLFGANRNYVLSVGAGVVKMFGDELEGEGSLTLPTIRVVNLGMAF